jgi:hypothetical protein
LQRWSLKCLTWIKPRQTSRTLLIHQRAERRMLPVESSFCCRFGNRLGDRALPRGQTPAAVGKHVPIAVLSQHSLQHPVAAPFVFDLHRAQDEFGRQNKQLVPRLSVGQAICVRAAFVGLISKIFGTL